MENTFDKPSRKFVKAKRKVVDKIGDPKTCKGREYKGSWGNNTE